MMKKLFSPGTVWLPASQQTQLKLLLYERKQLGLPFRHRVFYLPNLFASTYDR